jgi:hypothetical protein
MFMSERVHVFKGDRRLLQSRHIVRVMARCLTGDQDIAAEEGLAATYDAICGGDETLVGANMTMLINRSDDPREHVERVIMACDLLRRARRTAH